MSVRRTVVITEDQDRYLADMASDLGMNYSEAVRAVIDMTRNDQGTRIVKETIFLRPAPSQTRSDTIRQTELTATA